MIEENIIKHMRVYKDTSILTEGACPKAGFEVPISPRVNPLGKPGFTWVGF